MKKVAMFIAFTGFRDEEYLEPRRILEAAGVRVVTVSTARGKARGKFSAAVEVDKLVEEIDPTDYDALTLVGGPGALQYLDKLEVHKIFKEAFVQGKVAGAICISPVILAHSGLLKGKKVTCFPDGEAEVRQAGAECTGVAVEVDGLLVTANGPGAASDYGRALAELLK